MLDVSEDFRLALEKIEQSKDKGESFFDKITAFESQGIQTVEAEAKLLVEMLDRVWLTPGDSLTCAEPSNL